ncbi:MAG: PAS domain S-box protein [Anaerolineae bacterium]
MGETEQIALAGDGIVGRVWQQASGQFVREAAETSTSDRRLLESTDADTVIAVPIRIEDRTWGVLLVFLEYGSLFIEDDLNLVMLLVRQSAIFLENSTLLEQIRQQENDKRVAVETRLTRLLNTIAEAVISIDTSHRIVLFNQSAERYFGYGADEMMGQPIDRLLPDHVVGRHEKFIRDFADGSNIARGMGERHTELSAKRKDGSVFPIGRRSPS